MTLKSSFSKSSWKQPKSANLTWPSAVILLFEKEYCVYTIIFKIIRTYLKLICHGTLCTYCDLSWLVNLCLITNLVFTNIQRRNVAILSPLLLPWWPWFLLSPYSYWLSSLFPSSTMEVSGRSLMTWWPSVRVNWSHTCKLDCRLTSSVFERIGREIKWEVYSSCVFILICFWIFARMLQKCMFFSKLPPSLL